MWISILAFVGVLLAIPMLALGVRALCYRKMRLARDGRTIYGPLAQLCGLLLLASFPLSAITCGDVCHRFDWRPDPQPERAKFHTWWETDPKEVSEAEAAKIKQ